LFRNDLPVSKPKKPLTSFSRPRFKQTLPLRGEGIRVVDSTKYTLSYDMIYLTAIAYPPGGSSTVHIYTQTIHRTTQNKQYIQQHKN